MCANPLVLTELLRKALSQTPPKPILQELLLAYLAKSGGLDQ
jgi:hypothetical protein